ncbi:MAG TPA: CBS domain-containing protein [Candidatus Saccharimonadales bacterium]|jgi:CBS-domain-containing membrane protein|nr:CBS domain-containing protein [Candidatus Saccharimonadales bacterium]
MALKLRPLAERTGSRRLKQFKGSLVSLAGVVGQDVVNQYGQRIGKLADLVFRWDNSENYPPLTGLIVKVAGRQVWIGAENLAQLKPDKVLLNNAKLDLRDFKSREGEVRLGGEVLDHQLIDVDGARVVRASDLYLAPVGGHIRLVGLDVGYRSLLRRLGPRQMRSRPTPDAVIDWATIQSFGGQDTAQRNLKLSSKRQELRRMRPGELADLLEDLGRNERRELLKSLTPEQAADALEEMEPEELETILRESTPSEIARYLSKMEPDEAADALRDVDPLLREDLLKHMTKNSVAQVEEVLSYDEDTAGGLMNTSLMVSGANETIASVRERFKVDKDELGNLDAVVITNADGQFVHDIPLLDLLMANPEDKLGKLIKLPPVVTVDATEPIRRVAELLVESRRSSIVVLDEKRQPIGRILADDIVDALLPDYGRFHFPRLWS